MLSFTWFGSWSSQSCQCWIHKLFDLKCAEKKDKKKNLCSLNGLWATQSAGEGSRKETLMSDQPRHIATVKLLTPFSIFWSSSCEGLYLPISCRDVTAADRGLWSCHLRWCFVTRLSAASPSCFIFHASRQTCPSLHPRTVVKLELKQLSFFFFFWTSDSVVPEYEAGVWQNRGLTAPDTLWTLWQMTYVFVVREQQQKYDTVLRYTDGDADALVWWLRKQAGIVKVQCNSRQIHQQHTAWKHMVAVLKQELQLICCLNAGISRHDSMSYNTSY